MDKSGQSPRCGDRLQPRAGARQIPFALRRTGAVEGGAGRRGGFVIFDETGSRVIGDSQRLGSGAAVSPPTHYRAGNCRKTSNLHRGLTALCSPIPKMARLHPAGKRPRSTAFGLARCCHRLIRPRRWHCPALTKRAKQGHSMNCALAHELSCVTS